MITIGNLLVALDEVEDEGEFIEVVKSYLVPGQMKWFAVDGKHFGEEERGICVIEERDQPVVENFDGLVIFPGTAYRYEGKAGALALLKIARDMVIEAEKHAQES